MNEYMKIAKELSEDNLKTNVGGPFGACIVKDDKIIGKGSNQVLGTNDPTAHAEIVAIRNACKNINSYDLSGCELYTSCYPCPMCLSAIIWAFSSLICSTDITFVGDAIPICNCTVLDTEVPEYERVAREL